MTPHGYSLARTVLALPLSPHRVARVIALMLPSCMLLTATTYASTTEEKHSDRMVQLGERLFFDTRLSRDGTVSCATCHVPEKAFTDGLRVASGVGGKHGTRNTPSLLDVRLLPNQFWDGRRHTLEEQAADPLLSPVEHGMESEEAVVAVLRSDYEYVKSVAVVFGITKEQ